MVNWNNSVLMMGTETEKGHVKAGHLERKENARVPFLLLSLRPSPFAPSPAKTRA